MGILIRMFCHYGLCYDEYDAENNQKAALNDSASSETNEFSIALRENLKTSDHL